MTALAGDQPLQITTPADERGIQVGAAVRPSPFEGDSRDAKTAAAECNSVTPEGAFEWVSTEPERRDADAEPRRTRRRP